MVLVIQWYSKQPWTARSAQKLNFYITDLTLTGTIFQIIVGDYLAVCSLSLRMYQATHLSSQQSHPQVPNFHSCHAFPSPSPSTSSSLSPHSCQSRSSSHSPLFTHPKKLSWMKNIKNHTSNNTHNPIIHHKRSLVLHYRIPPSSCHLRNTVYTSYEDGEIYYCESEA